MKTIFKVMVAVLILASSNIYSQKKPNIIVILADDMGHGDVTALQAGCKYPTPSLDRLAEEGLAFTQAYSGSSVCTPTRYGLLTGRYCWREDIGLALNYDKAKLKEGQETIASLLKENGYNTMMVGKWHLGVDWRLKDGTLTTENNADDTKIDFTAEFVGGPLDHGFDSFFGIISSLDAPPYVLIEDKKTSIVPTERLTTERHRFGKRAGLADPNLQANRVLGKLTDRAVKLIKEQSSDKPFFLYFALNAPHSPVAPAPEFVGKSGVNEHADFRMEIDYRIGEILKALKDSGADDNTLVIFTADNGTAGGAANNKLNEAGHDTNDGRRGHKATLFEGGHRVPFLVRWPDGIKGKLNRRDSRIITLEDIIATCADIIDSPLPDEAIDCVSFLPQLEDKKLRSDSRDVIISSLGGTLIARNENWKLIFRSETEIVNKKLSKKKLKKNKKGKSEIVKLSNDAKWHERILLYNIHDDVAETTNVAKDNPEVVRSLVEDVVKAVKVTGRTNRGPVTGEVYELKGHQEKIIKLLQEYLSENKS